MFLKIQLVVVVKFLKHQTNYFIPPQLSPRWDFASRPSSSTFWWRRVIPRPTRRYRWISSSCSVCRCRGSRRPSGSATPSRMEPSPLGSRISSPWPLAARTEWMNQGNHFKRINIHNLALIHHGQQRKHTQFRIWCISFKFLRVLLAF